MFALVLAGATLALAQPPPKLMLWVWERATDLRFLKPAEAGVAYHFASLLIAKDGSVAANPRRQPLRLPPGVYRLPVVRVDAEEKAPFSVAQRAEVAAMIQAALRLAKTHAIQIDFDAPKSAWPFYRALLNDLRQRLGPKVFLSMTGLVSWCGANSWMTKLPVDEIVPMMFRMGYPAPSIPEQFPFEGCRASVGVELGTAQKPVKDNRRLYVFPGYKDWDAKTFGALQNDMR